MCRLFGLAAGDQPVSARFWLLDAPDSLELQGRRNPDGTGLGYFDAHGRPVVDKEPEPAYSDVRFISDAREVRSTTFVAHVRVSTGSAVSLENTHPFEADGRILAHNGGFEELDRLDAELGEDGAGVVGETDSERLLALITKRTRAADGDVAAGIAGAARWIAEHLPMFSLNLVLVAPHELWALRYPEHHRLFVLDRRPSSPEQSSLSARSASLAVEADVPAGRTAVVVASEPMDDDPAWRLMAPGELLHVDARARVDSTLALPDPPRRRSVDPLPYVP